MRVLIVKTSSLGDVVHAFSVLPTLQQAGAQVDWVAEQAVTPLVAAHPLVERVLAVDTRRWRKRWPLREMGAFIKALRKTRYDWLFDLQGNCKSALITACAKATRKVGFGKQSVAEWPNILVTNRRFNPPKGQNIREDYLHLVVSALGITASGNAAVPLDIFLEDHQQIDQLTGDGVGSIVLVCPGSIWRNKRLDDAVLLQFLRQVGEQYGLRFRFLWGSAEERQLADWLHEHLPHASLVVPKLSLPAVQQLMERVDLVVAMDSLPLHLCATTSTPTFSLFGPSLAAKYAPVGLSHYSVQGSCPYGKQFTKRCPILRTCSTGSCLREMTAEKITNHFVQWIESSPHQTQDHLDKRPQPVQE